VIARIKLERVHYMPKELRLGVLYVSKEFGTAAHLCACGCGEKIRTPLTPTEWTFKETPTGPSLHPSIGNWQKKCQSHYWINKGEIRWADKWSPARIAAGRRGEDARRKEYYSSREPQHNVSLLGFCQWVWSLIKNLFK
jgi:hypothetical protein